MCKTIYEPYLLRSEIQIEETPLLSGEQMFSCDRPLAPREESDTCTEGCDIFWYRTGMPKVKHLYMFICMVNILGKSEAFVHFQSVCCLL